MFLCLHLRVLHKPMDARKLFTPRCALRTNLNLRKALIQVP